MQTTRVRCTIYIVRRTQLYLDDSLWEALHARARSRKTTISQLVREAARERYLSSRDEQRNAMQEFVGSRKRASDTPDTVQYIRALRRGDRLDRLQK
jgi:predicted DNA-binding ribbon-helix-helix protein